MRKALGVLTLLVVACSGCVCGGPAEPDGGTAGGAGGSGGSGGAGGFGGQGGSTGWAGPDSGSAGFCMASWCWEHPLPQGNPLRAVRAVDGNPNDVWAVGGNGTALHWNGAAWSSVELDLADTLVGVWSAAPDDTWVSLQGSFVYRWNGTAWSWTRPQAPGGQNAIWGAAANDVWVVSDSAGIARFDGSNWSLWDAGASTDLTAVHGSAADNVWLVGTRGVVRRFDGAALQSVAVPDAGAVGFRAVWATGPGAAVALGDDKAVHFDPGGARVFQLPFQAGSSASVSGAAAHDLWAVANGTLLRFDGGVWADVGWAGAQPLRALDVQASGGWAVGDHGALVRFDGQRWSTYSDPQRFFQINGLFAASPTEGFAAAGVPLRFDGRTWSPLVSPPAGAIGAVAVHGTSGSDVWFAAAGRGFYHWDGGTLASVSSPTTETITAIHARAADDAWAVGVNGTVLHYDGSTWTQVPVPRAAHFRGVWVGTPSEVWVVGDDIVLKRTSTGWDAPGPDAGTPVYYTAVWGSGPSDVLLTTTSGLKRWDGATLSDAPAPGPAGLPLMKIWGAGPEDYYVSTSSRGIYRHELDGGWENLPIPTFFSATSLTGAGDRVWAGNVLGIFSRPR